MVIPSKRQCTNSVVHIAEETVKITFASWNSSGLIVKTQGGGAMPFAII